jgi:hypothetical protein
MSTQVTLPPHSIEAEQSLIGGLLLDPSAWDRIADIVAQGDFYRDDHRRIFSAIAKFAQAGQPFDAIVIANAMAEANESDQTGGLPFLVELANAASPAGIVSHARLIRDKAVARQWQALAAELHVAAGSGKLSSDIAAAFVSRANSLQIMAASPSAARWRAPQPINSSEWTSARSSPDVIVEDYLWADVAIQVAPGGTGKTTLNLVEAIHIVLGRTLWGAEIRRPGPVVILTAEDGREIMVARLRCIATDMGLSDAEIAVVTSQVLISDVSGIGFKLTEVPDDVVLPSDRCDQIVEALRPLAPSLLIIDPAVSFGVGESRVNDAEQGLIDAGRRLRNGLKCCVRFIHHTGKFAAREKIVDQYAGRGGSALADGARMVHVLAPISAEEWFAETGQTLDDKDNALRVVRPKQSYGRPNPPDFLIRRSGYQFKRAMPQENGRSAARDANADMLHRFLVSELAENRRHSRNTLETELPLKRSDLRAAIEWLLMSGRVEERKLSDSKQRGARQYLHPKEGAVGSPSDFGEAGGDYAK